MENQKTEWKRQWRDEFFKDICGLANTQGGTLEIGRDDNGIIVGIDNAKELLEELPNTIRHALGIVPSFELLTEDGKQYIAVSVDTSGTPVSYRGRHYIRSGSTTQELDGSELDNFILRRLGKTWDGIVIPKIKVSDLDTSAFRIFCEKAIASERLRKSDLDMGDEALLDSLSLIENGELTRAAVLLFHHNPEKYVFGAFVKVGYFENGADLIYQDEFHGSLITVADQIVDTIYRKYFKGIISYEGILRVTDYPVPRPALREAIFNAIVHRDYTTGIPIQIKVFPDCVIVYNDGRLPENWTVDNLLKKHRSRPYNPKIAYAFYRAGYIETWGRGIERITTACKEAGKREPLFEASPSEISVTFFTDVAATAKGTVKDTDSDTVKDTDGDTVKDADGDTVKDTDSDTVKDTDSDTVKDADSDTVNDTQKQILELLASSPRMTAKTLSVELGINERNVKKNIKALKEAGLIERVGSDKSGYWVVK